MRRGLILPAIAAAGRRDGARAGADAQQSCRTTALTASQFSEQCTYQLSGQASGATAIVGDAIVQFNWALDGSGVSGQACIEDTNATDAGSSSS
jgi:hypothetical protein